jgi:hypothetical protein
MELTRRRASPVVPSHAWRDAAKEHLYQVVGKSFLFEAGQRQSFAQNASHQMRHCTYRDGGKDEDPLESSYQPIESIGRRFFIIRLITGHGFRRNAPLRQPKQRSVSRLPVDRHVRWQSAA